MDALHGLMRFLANPKVACLVRCGRSSSSSPCRFCWQLEGATNSHPRFQVSTPAVSWLHQPRGNVIVALLQPKSNNDPGRGESFREGRTEGRALVLSKRSSRCVSDEVESRQSDPTEARLSWHRRGRARTSAGKKLHRRQPRGPGYRAGRQPLGGDQCTARSRQVAPGLCLRRLQAFTFAMRTSFCTWLQQHWRVGAASLFGPVSAAPTSS